MQYQNRASKKSSTTKELLIGAYYFPQSSLGKDLGERTASSHPWNESLMVQYAKSYFAGHDQPKCFTYDGSSTTWDDSKPDAVNAQITLAEKHGMDYFIFDTYRGYRNGKPVTELTAAFENFKAAQGKVMKFGLMFVLSGPRLVLPFDPEMERTETSRNYDLSIDTAKMISDFIIEQVLDQSYLVLDGRPCVWLMPSKSQLKDARFPGFIDTIRNECVLSSSTSPLILGVVRSKEEVYALPKDCFDAVTGYAFLPDFSPNADPIQDYAERLRIVENDWIEIAEVGDCDWLPPAVVGWDASPRGKICTSWPSIARSRAYPYTPIITDNTPEAFEHMLQKCAHFIQTRSRLPLLNITAWNEIGEGCALLPRISNGSVDDSFLRKVKTLKEGCSKELRS